MATHCSILAWEKSQGQRTLAGCNPWGHKELDTTEGLHFPFLSLRGEGGGRGKVYGAKGLSPCLSPCLLTRPHPEYELGLTGLGWGKQAWEPPAQSSRDPAAPGHLWPTTQVNQIGFSWVSPMPKPDAPSWPPPGHTPVFPGHSSVNVSLHQREMLTSDRVPGPVVTASSSVSSGLALLGREGLGQDPHCHTCRECHLPSVIQARGMRLRHNGHESFPAGPCWGPWGAGDAPPWATRGNSHTWPLAPLHGAQAETTLD